MTSEFMVKHIKEDFQKHVSDTEAQAPELSPRHTEVQDTT